MTQLDQFLKKRETQHSHHYNYQSIEPRRKYLIEETDLTEFWTLYLTDVKNNKYPKLLVKPRQYGMIRIDVDIKLLKSVGIVPEITIEDEKNIIDRMNVLLKKHFDKIKDENLLAVVLRKEKQTEYSEYVKIGIHIEYPFCLVDNEIYKIFWNN